MSMSTGKSTPLKVSFFQVQVVGIVVNKNYFNRVKLTVTYDREMSFELHQGFVPKN